MKAYPNCTDIADQFCISRRQAARDVEYLRDSMGAPIEYCHVRKGYYYTQDTFVLGHIMVTDVQRQGLSYLAEQYATLESEHARHLSRLFRRLIDNAGDEEADIALPLFPIDPAELSKFDTMQSAIDSRLKVDIQYTDDQGTVKSIRLSPYRIYSYNNENFVVGYCEPGRQIRFLTLAGILAADLTDSRFDLTPLLKQAEIVPELANEANIAYVRLSSPSYAYTYPFRFERVADDLFRVEYYDPYRLLSVIFASPIQVTVVSPKWLRNLYLNLLEKKLHAYLHDDKICHTPPVNMEWKRTESPKPIHSGGL
ncbi:WYL domain-containing protein [Paenibacillus sp.]|jgi:predicted DNA-binding transcriptional regulator YafY|uniref:helix-turn-helix transcriptional regulator n=1 Tax=Paenibacillus sp. TaxID=58172 RepID=UPI00283AB83B|nr:WYL domain-containing protein [Paenibacillus sp.]